LVVGEKYGTWWVLVCGWGMRVLVTGTSGFIGAKVAQVLLARGDQVWGIDNENSYYQVSLKQARRAILEGYEQFTFIPGDLADKEIVRRAYELAQPERVIHLAAQAGVRYSLEHPDVYIQSNIVGFQHMIDLAVAHTVSNFVYASSSSVYGNNTKQPFAVTDPVDHPISLYAATKKSNELVAHTYHHLYQLPTTWLRFFTVYGPWGRPDMAIYKFAELMRAGKPIDVYNHGKMQRDFTYIDDIVAGVIAAHDRPHAHEVFNLGNDTPETLESMIAYLEAALGMTAQKNSMELQPGDVLSTRADIDHTRTTLGRAPRISLQDGISAFAEWYLGYVGS
jgi:UDP-glucuronate 4-epimerase